MLSPLSKKLQITELLPKKLPQESKKGGTKVVQSRISRIQDPSNMRHVVRRFEFLPLSKIVLFIMIALLES